VHNKLSSRSWIFQMLTDSHPIPVSSFVFNCEATTRGADYKALRNTSKRQSRDVQVKRAKQFLYTSPLLYHKTVTFLIIFHDFLDHVCHLHLPTNFQSTWLFGRHYRIKKLTIKKTMWIMWQMGFYAPKKNFKNEKWGDDKYFSWSRAD